jgi:predicted DNA-binding protein (UPF0251 family)
VGGDKDESWHDMMEREKVLLMLNCPKMVLINYTLDTVNLTQLERDVIIQHICRKRTLEQTAELLDRSRNTIQNATNSALKKLEVALTEDTLISAMLADAEKIK